MISTVNNLEAEDSTSETCSLNARYKYTMDGSEYSRRLNPSRYFVKISKEAA